MPLHFRGHIPVRMRLSRRRNGVSQLPPGLKVIAVPALKNDTPRYRIEQRMTEAVVHEFIARTKYRIVSSEDSADAVLHGEITSFEAIPAVFDTTPHPDLQLHDRSSGEYHDGARHHHARFRSHEGVARRARDEKSALQKR